MTNGTDLVTVSYSVFSDHGKTSLIGSSDKSTTDEGRLRITFHHNWYQNVKERAPRVRFGHVHLYNNYYTVEEGHGYVYSWGVGYQSKIVAQNNYFELDSGIDPASVIWPAKGTAIAETGTMVNGSFASLTDAYNAQAETKLSTSVGWKPELFDKIAPTQSVPALVRALAGAGKLHVKE
jgi:pectate lyase